MTPKWTPWGGEGGRAEPPPDSGTPYQHQQHPWDQSSLLQIMMEVKHSIGRLDERTENLRAEVIALRNDVKGLAGKGTYWAGVALIFSVVVALSGAYWIAVSAKIDALAAQRGPAITREADPAPREAPQQ